MQWNKARSISDIPHGAGLYAFVSDGVIQYVGSSRNVRFRLWGHKTLINLKSRGVVDVFYYHIPVNRMLEAEKKAIVALLPEINKQGKPGYSTGDWAHKRST